VKRVVSVLQSCVLMMMLDVKMMMLQDDLISNKRKASFLNFSNGQTDE
jgi:hypothetical protein